MRCLESVQRYRKRMHWPMMRLPPVALLGKFDSGKMAA